MSSSSRGRSGDPPATDDDPLEVGQLTFVAAVLTGGVLLGRWVPVMAARSMRPAVYAMGFFSAFWSFERVAALVGS